MSFRLFIYYCALCGGGAALVGWVLGRGLSPGGLVLKEGVKGLFLGLLVALGIGLVDALWDLSLRRLGQLLPRVLAAVAVGAVGGFVGGTIGQLLYGRTEQPTLQAVFLVFGWTITGLLIGVSVGVFEYATGLARKEDLHGARRKVLNGLLGGTLGGLAGGVLSVLLRGLWGGVFRDKPVEELWSPSASGFAALGLCIGLLIGLARVILKEAWVSVESGFRAGREMILTKGETVIGRAESADLGLFGDQTVERTHARIVRQGDQYFVSDAGTPGGTYLNGERIAGLRPLRSGDQIRVGGSVLRFGERQKRKQARE